MEIGGALVYHVGEGQRVLIIISDIFGAFSGRHLAVADTFAGLGYNVYIPEILENPYDGHKGSVKDIIKAQSQKRMNGIFKHLT